VSQLRNRAAALATGDILAFVDADNLISPSWCRAAVAALGPDRVAVAGALCHAPDPGTWVQRMYEALRGRTRDVSDTEWLGSGNMAIRRSVFAGLAGFDESLDTCEDVDLCQRVRGAGLRVIADERLRSVHLGDPASLQALFESERWRGRDNLRVSLRSGFTLRSFPSVAIPVADLACAAAAGTGIVLSPLAGMPAIAFTTAALAPIFGFAMLRAARMVSSARLRPSSWPQAFVVACTYDAGRAAALVTRARHRRSVPAAPRARTA
jgi:hypothetical protein